MCIHCCCRALFVYMHVVCPMVYPVQNCYKSAYCTLLVLLYVGPTYTSRCFLRAAAIVDTYISNIFLLCNIYKWHPFSSSYPFFCDLSVVFTFDDAFALNYTVPIIMLCCLLTLPRPEGKPCTLINSYMFEEELGKDSVQR